MPIESLSDITRGATSAFASGAAAVGNATPLMNGTAAAGTDPDASREDHVHPRDTSKQDTLVSGTNIKTLNSQSILGAGNMTLSDSIGIVCSDEATALVTGANVITFHMPYALTLTEVFCGLSTPQTSGTAVGVDVLAGGASVFSTTITVDNTEDTSLTAAVPAVLSTTALTKGQKIQVSILSVGGTTAKGLKVYLVGYIP